MMYYWALHAHVTSWSNHRLLWEGLLLWIYIYHLRRRWPVDEDLRVLAALLYILACFGFYRYLPARVGPCTVSTCFEMAGMCVEVRPNASVDMSSSWLHTWRHIIACNCWPRNAWTTTPGNGHVLSILPCSWCMLPCHWLSTYYSMWQDSLHLLRNSYCKDIL